MTDRAQSESIGVILLVAVVIISISAGGVYALGTVTQSTDAPNAAVTGEIGTDGIALSHQGGDSLPSDDLRLIVRVNGSETEVAWADGTLSGSDDTFGPGEEWNVSQSYDPGSLVAVILVDKPSNSVFFRTEMTVKAQESVVSDVGGKIDAVDREGEIGQSDISTPRSTSTDSSTSVDDDAPSVTNFQATKSSDKSFDVTFESDEQLSKVSVDITKGKGNKMVKTLNADDFTESGTGPYTYTATYNSGKGQYTATLNVAEDPAGNDGANGQSDSVKVNPGNGG